MICSITYLSKQLVSIPSISPKDLGCQDIIASRLSKIGFIIKKINFNNTSNLWAYKGTGKHFSFAGHTDVVPPGNLKNWKFNPFHSVIKNNIFYGRGISDMKGAIAAMIIAVENFLKKYPKHIGKISFIITSDEESSAIDGTQKVVEYLLNNKEKIDYCLIGEPTNKYQIGDTIKNGRRGSLSFKIKIFGKQGHIAYPKLFKNPIHESVLFIQNLINLKLDDGNLYFAPSNLQISGLNSGILGCSNVIPEVLYIFGNIRFSTELSVKDIKLKIENLLKKHNLKNSIQWFLSGNPFFTNCNKFLKIVKKSIYQVTNVISKVSTSGGTSDGRFLNNIKNCQILEFGLTNQSIHKVNECAKISDLRKLSKIYELILKKIFLK